MVWYAFIAHIFSTKIIALNNALISLKHKNTALLMKQFHKYNKKKIINTIQNEHELLQKLFLHTH